MASTITLRQYYERTHFTMEAVRARVISRDRSKPKPVALKMGAGFGFGALWTCASLALSSRETGARKLFSMDSRKAATALASPWVSAERVFAYFSLLSSNPSIVAAICSENVFPPDLAASFLNKPNVTAEFAGDVLFSRRLIAEKRILIFRSPVLTLLKAEAIIIERRSTADASVLLSDPGVPFYNALKILGDQQFPEGKFHGILLDMEAERAMDLLAAVSRNIAAGFIKSLEKSAQKAEAAEPDKKGTAVFLKRPRTAGS